MENILIADTGDQVMSLQDILDKLWSVGALNEYYALNALREMLTAEQVARWERKLANGDY